MRIVVLNVLTYNALPASMRSMQSGVSMVKKEDGWWEVRFEKKSP